MMNPQVRPPGAAPVPVPVDRGGPPATGPDRGFFEGGPTGHRTGPGSFLGKKKTGQTGPGDRGHPVVSPEVNSFIFLLLGTTCNPGLSSQIFIFLNRYMNCS